MQDVGAVADPYRHLFQPIQIGGHEVRNRLVMTPIGGAPPHRRLAYFEARARGGIGMIVLPVLGYGGGVNGYSPAAGRFLSSDVNDADVVLPSPATARGIAFFDDVMIPELRAIGAVCHASQVVCFAQVINVGAARLQSSIHPVVSPSALPDEEDRSTPHELTVAEIGELVVAHAQSIRRMREAGLDGAEIHAAHGYLGNQFLSPYTNRRTDQYGGTEENRLRFIFEILDAAAALAGADFPIGLQLNGDDLVRGGLDNEAVAGIASRLAARLAYISVSGGTTTGLRAGVSLAYASSKYDDAGHNLPMAARIKRAVQVPVIVAGRLSDPDLAERSIAEGNCDLIGIARGLLADPELPSKVRNGRVAEIRPCVGLNDCHRFHHSRLPMLCTVNPSATREAEMAITPAPVTKSVTVVGGGPAGMEAAIGAAARGHRVTLFEAEAELGGQLRTASLDSAQPAFRKYLDHQIRALSGSKVDVRLCERVDRDAVQELLPDVLIVATGATRSSLWCPDRTFRMSSPTWTFSAERQVWASVCWSSARSRTASDRSRSRISWPVRGTQSG